LVVYQKCGFNENTPARRSFQLRRTGRQSQIAVFYYTTHWRAVFRQGDPCQKNAAGLQPEFVKLKLAVKDKVDSKNEALRKCGALLCLSISFTGVGIAQQCVQSGQYLPSVVVI